jgi:hypothetical protein
MTLKTLHAKRSRHNNTMPKGWWDDYKLRLELAHYPKVDIYWPVGVLRDDATCVSKYDLPYLEDRLNSASRNPLFVIENSGKHWSCSAFLWHDNRWNSYKVTTRSDGTCGASTVEEINKIASAASRGEESLKIFINRRIGINRPGAMGEDWPVCDDSNVESDLRIILSAPQNPAAARVTDPCTVVDSTLPHDAEPPKSATVCSGSVVARRRSAQKAAAAQKPNSDTLWAEFAGQLNALQEAVKRDKDQGDYQKSAVISNNLFKIYRSMKGTSDSHQGDSDAIKIACIDYIIGLRQIESTAGNKHAQPASSCRSDANDVTERPLVC